jgi:hypothetical protein
MNQMTKYDSKTEELKYFQTLANIAQKGGGNKECSPMTLMNIMLTAKDLGISPMKAVNGGFYIVNNKICMSTALMADRIRKDGHSIKIPEWTKDKCVIIGVRKDNGDSIKVEYTWEDAQLAGLTTSQTWRKFPKHMLYNRAMSTLARVLFSDVVGNAYSEDERWDIENRPSHARPLEDPCQEITVEMAPSVMTAQTTVSPSQALETTREAFEEPMEATPLQAVCNLLEADGLCSDRLEEYLENREKTTKIAPEATLQSVLMPNVFPMFAKSYKKFLATPVSTDAVTADETPTGKMNSVASVLE